MDSEMDFKKQEAKKAWVSFAFIKIQNKQIR